MPSYLHGRRRLFQSLGALGIAALAPRAFSDHAAPSAPPVTDWCGPADGGRLLIPGSEGWLGRLAARGAPLTLATAPDMAIDTPWPMAFAARHRGQTFRNPTLVFERGERARITLANTLDEPTIVHWHGLPNDTANDGAGSVLVQPGGQYAYDFIVRARAGLYWYHPHPHGLTAGQAYRGLFGLIAVEDADERALRSALDVVWGRTEIPLILQDRRAGAAYAPGPADHQHGFLGNVATVNGGIDSNLDVAARPYRFRILNASNARTYRLGFADAAGRMFPFTLLGTDGGLLAAPLRCTECFLPTAARIDVLLDLGGAPIGEAIVLETRAFDPMHFDPSAIAAPETAHEHHQAQGAAALTPGGGEPWADGAPRRLLTLRVRERAGWRGTVPARLSKLANIDVANAIERPLRLGFAKGRWRINDRVFDMNATPIVVARAAVETWLIRNYHTSMPHAMHLHGFQFRVLERETSPDQVAPLAIDARGRVATDFGWNDTVLVWPGESVKIAIDFRHPFKGEQIYVFHCHNLEHEDGGMMLRVKVG